MPASSSLALNSLVQGTQMEGKVKAKTDIRVDGVIKGDLQCDAKVIIGPTGTIEGTVNCRNAVIEGKFDGTLYVAELLNVRETANVTGEVTYGKLIVQSGAIISGSYKVVGEKTNSGATPNTDNKNTGSTSKAASAESNKGKAELA